MGLIATLAGNQIADAHLSIPAWGAAFHDVSLTGEFTLAGKVTLVVADLTLQCTVLSGGPSVGLGRSFYRVVAGSGGWAKTIPATSYANDLGVNFLKVLTDAALACGETLLVSTVPPTVLGPGFVRPLGPACRLLEQLAPNAWYVGEDGVTRLGARPPATLSAAATQTSLVDLARGTVTLASDTIANILPGLVTAGLTAVDVEHEISKGTLRSKLWGKLGTGASRRIAAMRAIVDQLDPDRLFRGVWEYRVVTQTGNRLNLQPVRVSTGLPNLTRVSMRPGVAGANMKPALGSRVLVGFVDSDPARPAVLGFEDPDGAGFVPISITFANGTAPVGRVGDAVSVTLSAVEIATISAPPAGGPCSGGPITLTGTIQAGSPIVKA